MGDTSKIEWTDSTWNPVVGCSAVSPGCDHCYAAREASGRLRHLPAYAGLAEGGVFTGEVRLLDHRLMDPLHWARPRRVFVNSMSDLFHPSVPQSFRLDIWQVMGAAQRHQFQILTKRPAAMSSFARRLAWVMPPETNVTTGEPYLVPLQSVGIGEPLPNVWLGTSIESDRYTWRANWLRLTPAAVRFLSLEPLLGPLPSLDLTGVDWVIVGGESGPGARPMHPDWARDIRDRCVAAGIPFLFKQWGEWTPTAPLLGDAILGVDGTLYRQESMLDIPVEARRQAYSMKRVGKKAAGRLLDGRTWDEYPA